MNTSQRVRKKFGTAIVEYGLIQNNDHILVAVSGGKDSLLMLTLLAEGQKRFPVSYQLTACHLKNELTEPAVREETASRLKDYFEKLEIPYIIRDLPVQSTSDAEKRVGCFWCSWMRRKILFNVAWELGIRKIALGHHKDDIIETFLLNLFYHGKLATMTAKLDLFEGNITLIRPLALLGEEDITKTVKKMGFPVSTYLCPYAGNTKRDSIKQLIGQIETEFKNIRTNLFNATRFDKIDPTYLN